MTFQFLILQARILVLYFFILFLSLFILYLLQNIAICHLILYPKSGCSPALLLLLWSKLPIFYLAHFSSSLLVSWTFLCHYISVLIQISVFYSMAQVKHLKMNVKSWMSCLKNPLHWFTVSFRKPSVFHWSYNRVYQALLLSLLTSTFHIRFSLHMFLVCSTLTAPVPTLTYLNTLLIDILPSFSLLLSCSVLPMRTVHWWLFLKQCVFFFSSCLWKIICHVIRHISFTFLSCFSVNSRIVLYIV